MTIAGGLFVIIATAVCALLIAANLFVRRNRRTTDDWQHYCSDCDERPVNELNSINFMAPAPFGTMTAASKTLVLRESVNVLRGRRNSGTIGTKVEKAVTHSTSNSDRTQGKHG